MKRTKAKPRKVGAKGAETRRLLIGAAAKLFNAKGIGATSLDEIAAEAGVTKGAIYDHFSGKNDLVFELFSGREAPMLQAFKDGRSGVEQLRALRDFLINSTPKKPTYITSSYEFNNYVASNPDLAKRLVNLAHDQLTASAAKIAETVQEKDRLLPALDLTLALSALHTGLMFHRLIAPELVSDEVLKRIYDAILGLSDGATQRKQRKKRAI